jgi:RimJ/RimL family protein N-acetyltransferase
MLLFPRTPVEVDGLARWVASRIPHVGDAGFGPCQAIGIAREGRLVAGVVFHDWQPAALTLQLSMAADTPLWASRAVLRGLFAYAFVTAGVHKLWTATPHDAARVLRFNRGVGLKPEATLRHHFGPRRHAVVSSMLRAEWERSPWHPGGP